MHRLKETFVVQDQKVKFFVINYVSSMKLNIPRSTVTDSAYGRKRSYTGSYTIVYMSFTLRIRPYFAGIHVIVLRSCMTVTVYGEIRRNMEIVYGAYILCIRSYTERTYYVYDRIRWRFSKSY
jgi:hypothetical protein